VTSALAEGQKALADSNAAGASSRRRQDDKMRQESIPSRELPAPIRPLRILIEDPHVELSEDPQLRAWPFDVTACAGPASDTEECPLVMDGSCPLGHFDVVVGALQGPWAASVRAAWAETGTVYADATGITTADPTDRVTHRIGVALQALYNPNRNGE
jgi:hypothetical protein